jgi:hypothetical protein
LIAGSYFEGFTYNFEVAYFLNDCASVLAKSQEVTEAFFAALTSWKVCVSDDGTSTCHIEDTTITCGQERSDMNLFALPRTRRSVEKNLVISFSIKSFVASSANCSDFCEAEITEQCFEACKIAMVNEATTTVQAAASKIESIFGSSESQRQAPQALGLVARQSLQLPQRLFAATISIPGVMLTPMFGTLRHELRAQCSPGTIRTGHTCGMQSHLAVLNLLPGISDLAVECPPGTYATEDGSECVPCPVGMHQPEPGQRTCIECEGFGASDSACNTSIRLVTLV